MIEATATAAAALDGLLATLADVLDVREVFEPTLRRLTAEARREGWLAQHQRRQMVERASETRAP
mgnify:CR=1 FL=1